MVEPYTAYHITDEKKGRPAIIRRTIDSRDVEADPIDIAYDPRAHRLTDLAIEFTLENPKHKGEVDVATLAEGLPSGSIVYELREPK